jgi:osmotically-inducible protein OsmY
MRADIDRADLIGRVFDELDWAQDVDARAIVIHCRDGVVTLTGTIGDDTGRRAARDAAFRVSGVRTLDDQLSLDAGANSDPANTEIALRVERALATSGIPRALLRTDVHDHIVTLTGQVDWGYEREELRRCVEMLLGVRYVINRLTVVRRPSPDVTMGLIREELAHNPLVDADVVHVSILDSEVTLSGIVQSDTERREAEHAAWTSPHVARVHNLLEVRPL